MVAVGDRKWQYRGTSFDNQSSCPESKQIKSAKSWDIVIKTNTNARIVCNQLKKKKKNVRIVSHPRK